MNDKSLIFLIAVANLIGFVYGVYYYSGQLSEWSLLFWILIIDCPIQALIVGMLFLLSAISERKGYVFQFMTKFGAAGAIKYGIWTMFVILFYAEHFLSGNQWEMYAFLFLAHLGLLTEGLLLSGIYKLNKADLALIGFFYLLNDYADYVIGTHPIIPNENMPIIALFTLILTFTSIGIVWYYGKKRKSPIRIELISRFLFS